MKTINSIKNSVKNYQIWILLSLSLLLAGCSYFAKHREQTGVKIEERSKELNSAAKISTEITAKKIAETKVAIENTNFISARLSIEGAEAANSVTSLFLRRNEGLIGLPIYPQYQIVENLLSTNSAVRKSEESKQNIKANEEIQLKERLEKLESKLIDLGAKKEAEDNKNIIKKVWGWSLSTLGIGGLIALCIFFPAIIPILGRLIGMVVEAIPQIAGFVGLVSKKAFSAVSLGVGNIRGSLKKEKELNPDKTYTVSEVLNIIDAELAKSTDKSHKNLIQTVRNELNV